MAVIKSAYISLIIGPRGLVCKANLCEIMGWESSDVDRFDLGPLFQGQTRYPKLKVLIIRLLLALEVCNVKPTYKKSWAGNLFYEVRFSQLLQGQTRLAKPKSAYN